MVIAAEWLQTDFVVPYDAFHLNKRLPKKRAAKPINYQYSDSSLFF